MQDQQEQQQTLPVTIQIPFSLAEKAYQNYVTAVKAKANTQFVYNMIYDWLEESAAPGTDIFNEIIDRLSAFSVSHNELAFLLSLHAPDVVSAQYEGDERQAVVKSLLEKELIEDDEERLTDRAKAQSHMFDMFTEFFKDTGTLPDSVELHDRIDA